MNTERWVGLGLLVMLVAHAAVKVETHILPEMLWFCHLATFASALGLLVGRPRLAVSGGLFHLMVGGPAWLLDLARHGTTVTSTLLHVATPAVGLWAATRHGVPRALALQGAAIYGVGVALGRLLDPALNVNMAWRAYEIWPPSTPMALYHAVNLGALLALLSAARWGLEHWGKVGIAHD